LRPRGRFGACCPDCTRYEVEGRAGQADDEARLLRQVEHAGNPEQGPADGELPF
jgi:hypothetical protein